TVRLRRCSCFVITGPAPTELYTLSLHDALPICPGRLPAGPAAVEQPAQPGRSTPRSSPEPLGTQRRTSSEDPRTRAVLSRQRRRSEEHTSELQSRGHLVCRLLLEKKNDDHNIVH